MDPVCARRALAGLPVPPDVVAVDGHVVVEAGFGEEGGRGRRSGRVRVVMAEDHLGHLLRLDAGFGERPQDEPAVGGHAGADDGNRVALGEQGDGAGDAVACVAGGQGAKPQPA